MQTFFGKSDIAGVHSTLAPSLLGNAGVRGTRFLGESVCAAFWRLPIFEFVGCLTFWRVFFSSNAGVRSISAPSLLALTFSHFRARAPSQIETRSAHAIHHARIWWFGGGLEAV